MGFEEKKSNGGPDVDMNNISNVRKTEVDNDVEA